jgi:hypothetical protein
MFILEDIDDVNICISFIFFLYSYFGLFWRRDVQDSVFYISQGHRGSKVFPRSSCHWWEANRYVVAWDILVLESLCRGKTITDASHQSSTLLIHWKIKKILFDVVNFFFLLKHYFFDPSILCRLYLISPLSIC